MKNYLFVTALSTMMLAACSNDDSVPLEGPGETPEGSELTLSLNTGGDGLGTRASRPVNSSEAANNVTAVRLYIYNPAGVDVTSTALAAGTPNPVSWTAGPTTPTTPGTDVTHQASQMVKLNKLSGDGTYTVVAYGYNSALDYTVIPGTKANDSFTATPVPLPLANEAELFAGKKDFVVVNGNAQSGANSEVVLKRQVAGLLAYFKNIPVLYPDPNLLGVPTPVAFVRVYASSHSPSFTFPSVLPINGTGNNTRTKVLEFNLATLITDFLTQVSNAGTNLTKVFNIPLPTGPGAPVLVANSALTGRFLVPFAQVAGNTTFTVQLENALGGVLKSWDVVNNALAPNSKIYDVQRNYFYSLGQKVQAGSTDGGTPGTPTTDDDQPIDLSQETVITVTVNDAWDMIYNLGIE